MAARGAGIMQNFLFFHAFCIWIHHFFLPFVFGQALGFSPSYRSEIWFPEAGESCTVNTLMLLLSVLQVWLRLSECNILENRIKMSRRNTGKWKKHWSWIEGDLCPRLCLFPSTVILVRSGTCPGFWWVPHSLLGVHLTGLQGQRAEFSALEIVVAR